MVAFSQALGDLLPEHLHEIIKWDFIPLDRVKDRHADLAAEPLTALFEAYLFLDSYLNLKARASQEIPEETWGCMRCGFCCSSMRPGPVTAGTFRSWKKAGAPVAWFYSARGREKRNSVYRCWFHNGVHLRICPFLLINQNDSRPFCSIYDTGDDHRPPMCSGYKPRHESCNASHLEIEPWESN